MTTRWARFARGWIVAAFSTFVAALSHTVGVGAVPGLLAVVVSLAFAGIVSVALSARTLSTWRLSVAVLLSQLIFHTLFSFGSAGGALVTTDAATAHANHAGSVAVSAMPPGSMSGVDHGLMMALAHVLAAVVTVVALRFGERAFWGLFSTATMALKTLVRVIVLTPIPNAPRAIAASSAALPPRDLLVLLSSMRHRGPPVRVFA
ncbi:hypothetical protein E3O42_00250 [Cryobacterium adonitolivorans]|uniref:Uncharacterized protein n=1 Tax=Cryobacterium adonitolivorans TaxID=1259189 RepID=A0A4R8WGN6_9MICO|nr:hypothetical protein [Cryobacterium adonitolivorans]TFC07212.1 hypothetical protein E3O42_00250 [Cryobacterium adonitolivorans]